MILCFDDDTLNTGGIDMPEAEADHIAMTLAPNPQSGGIRASNDLFLNFFATSQIDDPFV
jgi:hypothetical protein